MPNWIEGSLRIRAPYENMLAFFEKGIDSSSLHLYIDENNESFEVAYLNDNGYVYIQDTQRAFLYDIFDIEVNRKDADKSGNVYAALQVRQAYCFNTQEWRRISKRFGIDIRLTGYECGMCVKEEIEIVHGHILCDSVRSYETYNDWLWEAEMPFMGG